MGKVRPYSTDEAISDEVTGVEVVPEYDRQRRDFMVRTENGDECRAERLPDLQRKLRDALRRGFGLRWNRSIVLEHATHVRWPSRVIPREGVRVELAIGFARGEVATRARDGRLLFRAWQNEDFDEDMPEILNPPETRIVSVLEDGAVVRPYTDAAWKAVRASQLAFARVRAALAETQDLDALVKAADLRTLLLEVREAEKAAEAARRAE